jgi:hypothetical protein
LGINYQTIDIGILYRFSPTLRMGLMVKNIADIYESSNSPDNTPENADFSLPVYTTLGLSAQYRGLLLSLDNELIYGDYGGTESKKATFWFVRAGVEKKLNQMLVLRCGLSIPVKARTDTLGNIRNDLPWPKMGGAVGIGVKTDRWTIDFAVYGDPAESYVNQEIRVKTVLSLTVSL